MNCIDSGFHIEMEADGSGSTTDVWSTDHNANQRHKIQEAVRVSHDKPPNSGQIVGECGGTAFPFRFWRGNAVPLAYTTAVSIGVTFNHAMHSVICSGLGSLECFVIIKCTKSGQLIRRNIKIVATRCQIFFG